MTLAAKIHQHALQSETTWGVSHRVFSELIKTRKLEVGIEIGVAFGGHIEMLLRIPTVKKIYGVDPYEHYEAPSG